MRIESPMAGRVDIQKITFFEFFTLIADYEGKNKRANRPAYHEPNIILTHRRYGELHRLAEIEST